METLTKLKTLLCNFWIIFFDLRNAHWNIEAQNFLELHKLFESLYSLIEGYADNTAERIRQLGDHVDANMKSFRIGSTILAYDGSLITPVNAITNAINQFDALRIKIIDIMQNLWPDEATRNLLAGMVQ